MRAGFFLVLRVNFRIESNVLEFGNEDADAVQISHRARRTPHMLSTIDFGIKKLRMQIALVEHQQTSCWLLQSSPIQTTEEF